MAIARIAKNIRENIKMPVFSDGNPTFNIKKITPKIVAMAKTVISKILSITTEAIDFNQGREYFSFKS